MPFPPLSALARLRAHGRDVLVGLAGFLLPWQTVWLLRAGELSGQPYALVNVGIFAGDIVLFALAVFGFIVGTRRSRVTGVIAVLAIAGFGTFNILRSPDVLLSAVGWVRMALLVLATTGAGMLARHARAFLYGFLAAMGVHAMIGIVQFLALAAPAFTALGIPERAATRLGESVVEAGGGRWLRAYGGFPHPNVFGTALLCAIMGTATLLPRAGAALRIRRAIRIAVIALFTFVLVLTFSRAAWIGAAILFGVLAVRPRTQYAALAGALTLLAAFTTLWPLVATRLDTSERLELISVQQRYAAIDDAHALLTAHPLLGVGLHAMPRAIADVTPARDPATIEPVHDVPVLAIVEVGVLGMIIVVFALVAALVASPGFVAPWVWLSLLPAIIFDHHPWSLSVGSVFFIALVAISVAIATGKQEGQSQDDGTT
ncbi:MAG: O-antigen ligase family protein [bacterium]|nr:O-antigen ligase family protein [bacterium]